MRMDAIREALETTFQSEFPAAQPGIPVRFDNVPFEQPKGSPWVDFCVQGGVFQRANIGAPNQFKQWGVVNVTCMVPKDSGNKVCGQLADSTMQILADRQISVPGVGSVTLYGGERRDRGVINGWWTINVMLDFRAFVTRP